MHTASCKVAGGKLLRLKADVSAGKLAAPQLSGDFFLMPPEQLPALERFLIGWPLDMPNGEAQLTSRLEKFLGRERITLSGIDAAAIAHVVDLVRAQAGIVARPDTRRAEERW